KIIHTYNFIDDSIFKPLKIPKKKTSILFIGRLDEQKNLFNLFDALSNLKEFDLDIIGTGPLERVLKKKANALGINVNFLGIFQNNKMPEIINQYELFILPSLWEGNPKVLLEAMSCGLACIGTNVRGIKNIINHKENGYLCERDVNSIKEAIKSVYDDNSLRNKMAFNAREFILENCSLDSIVKKEYSLYNEVLKKKS
ncbi:MAG: glycosyltransferase family 1 protein, partial [Promethearchaeota archaeon]